MGSSDRLAQAFLRNASPQKCLRRLPVLGNGLKRLSDKISPSYTRTWAQVEGGAAAGLWLRLNPRTGLDTLQGAGDVCKNCGGRYSLALRQ